MVVCNFRNGCLDCVNASCLYCWQELYGVVCLATSCDLNQGYYGARPSNDSITLDDRDPRTTVAMMRIPNYLKDLGLNHPDSSHPPLLSWTSEGQVG